MTSGPSVPADLDARVDPELAAVLAARPAFRFEAERLPKLREILSRDTAPVPRGVSVTDEHTTGHDGHPVLVRLYRPEAVDGPLPALYWIHGGGLVVHGVANDDRRCGDLALDLGIVVASVEYRLAPEHPYPAPLEDCHAGLVMVQERVDAFGIDAERIAVGGASAGGGLAAALALLIRDRGTGSPCFQLLRYPMIDDRNRTPSSRAITDDRVWSRTANDFGWNAYLDGRAGAEDVSPYAAPARAQDLSGLPPAVITVGGLDLFLDEDLTYAQRLGAAGVDTELHVYPGAFHGVHGAAPDSAIVRRWEADERRALRRALFPGIAG